MRQSSAAFGGPTTSQSARGLAHSKTFRSFGTVHGKGIRSKLNAHWYQYTSASTIPALVNESDIARIIVFIGLGIPLPLQLTTLEHSPFLQSGFQKKVRTE
jgi:hypothetical protein